MKQMRTHVVLNKTVGQTPLQAIERWKTENPLYKDIAACYAGRLDPMASGKLLVLLGDECKRQERYHGLDKEYEIEVLLDIKTDTGDILGMPNYNGTESRPDTREIRRTLGAEQGSKHVVYPAYSSKTVNGKPLFMYALEGTLDSIEIPTHTETIYHINLLRQEQMPAAELHARIRSSLQDIPRSQDASKALGADFRQDAVRGAWEELFSTLPERSFAVLSLRVTCGTGTYMRTLAERLGDALGTTALALSIHRTRIGTYWPPGIWVRDFSR